MYIHKLGGSWMQHPFLRNRFLVTDPADIKTILASGIEEVWIDCSKGDCPSGECTRPPEEAAEQGCGDMAVASVTRASAGQSVAPQVETEAQAPVQHEPPSPPPTGTPVRLGEPSGPMHVEVERARKLCWQAKDQVLAMWGDARMGKAIDPKTTLPLVKEISVAVERNAAAILSVARLKTHDDYTYLHSVAVGALMLALANQLNLDEEQKRQAGVGGLMHDLGKALMPLEVLNKPGRLTDAEFAIMKKHPAAGAQLLRKGGAERAIEDIALHHHERVDGKGYPHGLREDDITVLARMGAVCDVYDAVTSERAYKKPWDPAHAMREMARWHGQFDKRVFNAFVKSVGIYPVGSLVRLASQRLAVVIEPGADSLLTPKVKAFFSLRAQEPIPVTVIDLAAANAKDNIVAPEDLAKWGFENLESLWQ